MEVKIKDYFSSLKTVGKADNRNDALTLAWDYISERFETPNSISLSITSDGDKKFYKVFYT